MKRTLPLTRGDCANVPRPCPHYRCRYSLALDDGDGSASCVLDVADRGGESDDVVAKALGMDREDMARIEGRALRKLMAPKALGDFKGHHVTAVVSQLGEIVNGSGGDAKQERDEAEDTSFEAVLKAWRSPDAPKSGTQMKFDFSWEGAGT